MMVRLGEADQRACNKKLRMTRIKDKKLACILDGEVVGWDAENGVVVPFGSNR